MLTSFFRRVFVTQNTDFLSGSVLELMCTHTHTFLHTHTHTHTQTYTHAHAHAHSRTHTLTKRIDWCVHMWVRHVTRMNESCHAYKHRCLDLTSSAAVPRCVAVCCSVLHCVAVCCSLMQCVAVCRSVMQCVAVCCSVSQCVAVYCSAM